LNLDLLEFADPIRVIGQFFGLIIDDEAGFVHHTGSRTLDGADLSYRAHLGMADELRADQSPERDPLRHCSPILPPCPLWFVWFSRMVRPPLNHSPL
jgi:hypothetical protein